MGRVTTQPRFTPEGLLAIDPGARTGLAWFWSGVLVYLVGCAHDKPAPPPLRSVSRIVFERPVYRRTRGPRDATPEDLITLAIRAGLVAGAYAGLWQSALVESVTPKEWKGDLPKHISHARIRAALSVEERKITEGAGTDELDAVGIGLFALGRKC